MAVLNTAMPLLLCLILLSPTGCTVHTGQHIDPSSIDSKTYSYHVENELNYSNSSDPRIRGDIYIPDEDRTFPAILLIHGGSWSSGQRSHMNSIAKRLAKNGFVAFNISYRFAPEFHHPAQIEDCNAAINWMRENAAQYKINPKKVGVWGYSAGAHLAAFLGVTLSDNTYEGAPRSSPVQAVVGGGGPYNFLLYPNDEAIERFLGVSFKEDPKAFENASPVFHVTTQTPPMFLYHGTWDRIVDSAHTIGMSKALDDANVRNELYLVKGMGHIPLFLFDWLPVSSGIDFLKSVLKSSP